MFRIDKGGSAFLVADQRASVETFAYAAALGTYSAHLAGGAGLNFALATPVDPANLEASASSSQDTKISLTDGRFLFMTDAAESAFVSAVEPEIVKRPGSQYYFVRDAIQAKGIGISLSSADEAKLGGAAKINDLVSLTPGFSTSGSEQLEVTGTFDQPLNVCTRAVQLFATSEGGEQSPTSGEVFLAPESFARVARQLE